MPLADDGRLVARALQHLGKGRLAAVEATEVVVHEAILVAVLAGQNGGARRTADGVAAIGSLKQQAFPGDAVDVGSRRDLFVATALVCRDGLQRVIVGEDEENVRALGGSQRHQRGDEKRKGGNQGFHGWDTLRGKGLVSHGFLTTKGTKIHEKRSSPWSAPERWALHLPQRHRERRGSQSQASADFLRGGLNVTA